MMTFMLALSLSAPPYSPYVEDRVQALENQLRSMQAAPKPVAAKPPVVLAYPRPMAGPGITVYAAPVAASSSTVTRSRTSAGIPVTRTRLFGYWR